MSINSLCYDVMGVIFKKLDAKILVNTRLVCVEWRKVIDDEIYNNIMKEYAIRRLQLWWKLIFECRQYFIIKNEINVNNSELSISSADEDIYVDGGAIYSDDDGYETDPDYMVYKYTRDVLLDVNKSYTDKCSDCHYEFKICPDVVCKYVEKNREEENPRIAVGYCNTCFQKRLIAYIVVNNNFPSLRYDNMMFHWNTVSRVEEILNKYKMNEMVGRLICPSYFKPSYYVNYKLCENKVVCAGRMRVAYDNLSVKLKVFLAINVFRKD